MQVKVIIIILYISTLKVFKKATFLPIKEKPSYYYCYFMHFMVLYYYYYYCCY